MKLSPRANRVWLRLEQMFGDDLRIMHPNGMADAMAQVVDRVDDETVKEGLMRIKGMRRPPNLREFSEAMDSIPLVSAPNLMPALVAYAMKNLNLTEAQYTQPWTWLHEGDARPGSTTFRILGARIPGDPQNQREEIFVPISVLQ